MPTARMAAALDRLDRPCREPEFVAFRRTLGISTEIARGPHVLLLHERTDAEAAERVALVERVMTAYYLFFAGKALI